MIRGLYLAGTGMLVQRSKMDVITNNITNVDTLGYKKDTLLTRSFEDLLIERMNDPSVVNLTTEVGPLGTGTHIDEVSTIFQQGTLEQTSLSTDVAIEGQGFFVIDTPDGVMYTRSGNFKLDNELTLVTNEGYYVLDEDGNSIQVNSDRFLINEAGEVFDLDTNEQLATLQIVEFEDTGALRKAGENLFYDFGGGNPAEAENSKVLQGYMESSNVNIAQEMVEMIVTNRAYESNQQAVRMVDQTLDRTVNDLARF